MDKFWLNKAHQYISDHASFSDVSDIVFSGNKESAVIQAVVSVNLPALYLAKGESPLGVQPREPVTFFFAGDFPLTAPGITLRDDFPRAFPHINPNKRQVVPCIYDGSLSELLQQSEWINGILNQLVDWLEKAASNALLDYSQGWEPMRNDNPSGFISYDMQEAIKHLEGSNWMELSTKYEELKNGFIITGPLCIQGKGKPCLVVFGIPFQRTSVDYYVANPVKNLSDLYKYAQSVGISELKNQVELADNKSRKENKLFVVLAIPRPCVVIGSHTNIEFIHFVIHKSNRKKNKKRVIPSCEVSMLSHLSPSTPALMKRLSGSKHLLEDNKSIALIGCGSLGAKIGMHLARNGVGPFLCVDSDIFLPHNNARHALYSPFIQYKANFLALAMGFVAQIPVKPINSTAPSVDYSDSSLIIDSSASMTVRSFLMSKHDLPPIVSAMLYDSGRCGILLQESANHKTRLADLWAKLYHMALKNEAVRNALFNQQKQRIAVGQSCSSYTLVVNDAQISVFAAMFSLRIHKAIENGLTENGKIHFGVTSESCSLSFDISDVCSYIEMKSVTQKNWTVRLSSDVAEEMAEQSLQKKPNETGGVLLGSVFMNAKTIVVTDILPPPSDSEETPALFVLGTEGLEAKIKSIERRTCGKVTYLGTWHSHPGGGGSSDTDRKTAERLLFVRNYEPTVCLIWTPEGVFEI